jgi:hypothetical protein
MLIDLLPYLLSFFSRWFEKLIREKALEITGMQHTYDDKEDVREKTD